MLDDIPKEDITALYDGLCASNNLSYNQLQSKLGISKRGFYLARKNKRFPKKRGIDNTISILAKNSKKSLKEIIESGRIIQKIKKANPAQLILHILNQKKLTIQELSMEIGIKKGTIERWLSNPNFGFRNNRICLLVGCYCLKNSIELNNFKNNFIDLRKLSPNEITHLVLGLMKCLKLSNEDFKEFGIPPTTISRWLKSQYKILQYKHSFILNGLIKKSKLKLEKLIFFGKQIKHQLDILNKKFNLKIISCSFKLDENEKLLIKKLRKQFSKASIVQRPRVHVNGLDFEPDAIMADQGKSYIFEITNTKHLNLYLGYLQSRALFLKKRLKPDYLVLICNINLANLFKYSRLIRSGIFICSIKRLKFLREDIEEQKEKLVKIKSLTKANITSGKELKLFRELYFGLSQQQLAALIGCSQQYIWKVENADAFNASIKTKLRDLKGFSIREIHSIANKRLGKLNLTYPEIILDKGRGTHGMLDKKLEAILKSKGYDVISNVVLANKDVTVTVEADVYLPEKKVVISCKDSVRTKAKSYTKLIWDLIRYKYIEEVKGVKFYCPSVPNMLVNLLKKYGIRTLQSEEQLVKSL